ncbi:MAG TPA: hypothetical protein VN618_08150 [Solirubrobacteraceae bacterium]|nr:hypothetical protein [Solirubrobacteraceae bacterium]
MTDVEKANALLQAAGMTGVTVQEAPETVTISRAELDALRASQGAPAETPGQAYVRQQQEAAQNQLPEGILSAEETRAEMDRIESLPVPQQNAMDKSRVVRSWEYHAEQGAML